MNNYSIYRTTQYYKDLDYCKQFIFSFGSNYTLGVKIFPKDIQQETILFYAFVRYPDELVDNPHVVLPGQTHNSIDEYINEWKEVVYRGPKHETHPILRATYWIFKNKKIPFEYSFDFLEVMKQDILKERYKNYTELEEYMWGSASVVGYIMTYIVGYSHSNAFDSARSLGEAMQLANILRDVSEDFTQRNRIYLPQDDMALFGVHEHMIPERVMTLELCNFIKHYCERTEKLFIHGIRGIKYLQHGKLSVLLASRMYRENIRILKRRNFDIFSTKIKISKYKKINILISTLIIYPFFLLKHK